MAEKSTPAQMTFAHLAARAGRVQRGLSTFTQTRHFAQTGEGVVSSTIAPSEGLPLERLRRLHRLGEVSQRLASTIPWLEAQQTTLAQEVERRFADAPAAYARAEVISRLIEEGHLGKVWEGFVQEQLAYFPSREALVQHVPVPQLVTEATLQQPSEFVVQSQGQLQQSEQPETKIPRELAVTRMAAIGTIIDIERDMIAGMSSPQHNLIVAALAQDLGPLPSGKLPHRGQSRPIIQNALLDLSIRVDSGIANPEEMALWNKVRAYSGLAEDAPTPDVIREIFGVIGQIYAKQE